MIQEKKKPHYLLAELKKLLSKKGSRMITQQSMKDAASLGFASDIEMVAVVNKLESHHFQKSMTTIQDHKLWQDVYYFQMEELKLYIKLQKSFDGKGVIISFHKGEF